MRLSNFKFLRVDNGLISDTRLATIPSSVRFFKFDNGLRSDILLPRKLFPWETSPRLLGAIAPAET